MATQYPGKQVVLMAMALAFACFQVALHAQQQMPKPIQDQSFARPLSSQSSNLRSVQAYERVGKRIFPSQPTGQTVLDRSRSPWIERFLKPKASDASGNAASQERPSVAGSQPPLQNSDSRTPAFARPQTRSSYDVGSRYTQSPTGTSSQSQTRNQNFPVPRSTSNPSTPNRLPASSTGTASRPPVSTPAAGGSPSGSRVGIGSIPGFERAPSTRSSTTQTARSSRPDVGSTTSTRTSRTKAFEEVTKREVAVTNLARTQGSVPQTPAANEAPRVSRVPLPRKSSTKTLPKAATQSASKSDKVASAAPKSVEASPSTTSGLNRPARVAAAPTHNATVAKPKVAAADIAQAKPKTDLKPSVAPNSTGGGAVSVPTRLVNTPKSKSAAFDEANTRPPALYLATQIQKSKSPVAKAQTEHKAAVVAAKDEAAELELSLPKIPDLPTPSVAPPADEAAIDAPSLALPSKTPPPVEQPAAISNSKAEASVKVAATESEVKQPELTLPKLDEAKPADRSVASGETTPQVPSLELKTEVAATQKTLPKAKPSLTPKSQSAGIKPSAAKRMPPVSREQTTVVASNEAVRVAATPEATAVDQSAATANLPASVVSNSSQPTRTTLAAQSMARFGASRTRGLYRKAADERMHTQSPNIRVVLNGPSNVPVGTPAEYEIQLINEDQLDLEGLLLRVEVPAGVAVQPGRPEQGQFDMESAPDGATMVTWGIQQVPGGRVVKAPIRLAARQAKDFNIGLEWTLIPITRSTSIHVISPQVELAIVGPKEVNYGESNTYRVRVRNHGDAVAENVVLQVAAKDHGTSKSEVGNIAPGGEELMEIELQFEQRGKIDLSAVANAANAPVSKTGMDVLVRKAELVSQLSAPQMVYHGTAVSYVATVMNTGDAPATDVQGVMKLPSTARPTSLPYGALLNGSELKWKVDRLAPNEKKEFRFQIDLAQEGENPVGVHFAANSGEKTEASVATLVQAIADLKLLVSDPVAPAPVGSEVVYELSLTNRGSKAAHNVRVVAQFSKGIEPTRSGGHGYRVVPGQVFFDPIGTVAAGQTVKLQIFALADTDGMHRFRAEVRTDDESIRLVQEESTQYLNTQMRIATPQTTGSTLR